MAERLHDNAVRWQRGDTKGHVESFFLKANDPDSDRAFWLKFTIYAPVGGQGAVAEVWAILFDREAGHRAAKDTYPVGELQLGAGGVGLAVQGCEFEPGRTRGAITGPEGEPFRWELEFDGAREPLRPFPYEWMYTAPFPKSKSLTPTSNTLYRGFVEAGGHRFEVQDWIGMQGHNWGRSHAERYAWAHCNAFVDEEGEPVEAVFEGFSAKIKVGPVVTPFLTAGVLVHEGQRYEFTQPAGWLRASTEVTYTGWDFVCRQGRYRLLGSVWTTPEEMVGLTYLNPAGGHSHCLNSKIASCEIRLADDSGTLLRLRSPSKAALEVTVKEPEHGIRMYV